jgi:hypothetical protein
MRKLIEQMKNQSGFTTLIFLTLLLMLSLLGINAIMTSTTDVNIAGYELNSTYATYAAEAGVEKATAALTTYYRKFGRPPTTLPNDSIQMGKYSVVVDVTKSDSTMIVTMTQGAYRGLYALTDQYTVRATARSQGLQASKTIATTVDAALVPIYQFAVFYEQDLEIAPGPPMTLGGRVHSNNDMYLQSNEELYLNSYTTAAGNMFHGRHPESGQSASSGDVMIMDQSGNYQAMENSDGTWLDSEADDWVSSSIDRWDGRVEDSDHGMSDLTLPVVTSGEAKDMINEGESGSNPDSYEDKAGLKIVGGQVLFREADSSWSDVTSDFINDGIISTGTFHDGRETQDVTSLDLDISRLGTSSYWPDNGIVYASNDDGSLSGTRLTNGSQLHDKLTVASADPVYTVGDYNTVNKKPASIMSDALTILSNDWEDSKSWLSRDDRKAVETTVNIAYMTGNKASADGKYSGGFENLPRFLEDWNGIDFNWKGSAAVLWQSDEATGNWGGTYYKPPNRKWQFDTDFLNPNNLPPGTPLISIVRKTSWREITPDYASMEDES